MSIQLNPYLNFPGTAREAMTFYQSVLGGELEVVTFADMGASDFPNPDQVMHASLTTSDGFAIMASDLPPGMDAPTAMGSVWVSLSGTDAKLRDYWNGISEGGTVTMPFEKQMWGDEFGSCIDRFGTPWMINLGSGEGGQ